MLLVRSSSGVLPRAGATKALVVRLISTPSTRSAFSALGQSGSVANLPVQQAVAGICTPKLMRFVRCYASVDEADDGIELEIKVGGMMCDGCTSRVTEALQKASPAGSKVDVSLEKALASVTVKAPSQLDALNMLPKLVETVKNLGFEAEPHIAGL